MPRNKRSGRKARKNPAATPASGGPPLFSSSIQRQSAATKASPQDLGLSREQCKQKGNECYKLFRFRDAERLYTQGISASCDRGDGGNDDTAGRARAILHSNRASARFEMGDYVGAARDSSASLEILRALSSDDDAASTVKNQWRLARALFYGGANDASNDGEYADEKKIDECDDASGTSPIYNLPTLKQLALDCEATNPNLTTKIQSLLRAQELATQFSDSTQYAGFTPQLIRHNKRQGISELFIFGHDEATSALGWDSAESKGHYDVLFGGVGDGRHVMATLLDAADTTKRFVKPRLRIVMNDIHPRTLLKSVMVLVVSHKIGQLAPDVESVLKDKEVCLLMSVIYYSTMSYAMPMVVLEKFQSLLREVFVDSNREDFARSYPWLVANEKDWEALSHAAELWVDTSLFDPPLPPVEQALLMNNTGHSITAQLEFECGIKQAEVEASVTASGKEKFERQLEKYSHIENYTPGMLRQARAHLGQDATDEEIIGSMLENLHNQYYHDNPLDAKNEKAFLRDKSFFASTGGALMPPIEYDGQPLADLLDVSESILQSEKGSDEAKRHIRDAWKTNPVKFCPDWPTETDSTNYIAMWYRFYFIQPVVNSFKESLTLEERVKLLYSGTFFEHVTHFYWNLGRAIESLRSSNLSVELNTDCILNFCNVVAESKGAREEANLATSFSTCFMSNIPDYTGLLSAVLELHQVLETDAGVKTNILMNTGLFRTYDQYLLGSIGMAKDDLAKVLGITFDDKPDLWSMWNTHRFTDIEVKHPIELKTWLHRIFLNVVYPSQRKSRAVCREERPGTVDLFLRACAFCIDTLGYAEHLVMGAIDELLGKELKTKASFVECPPTGAPETSTKRYNISACQLELRSRLALWIGSGRLPATLASLDKIPSEIPVQYKLNLTSYPGSDDCNGSNCFGMLLEKKRNPQFDDQGDAGDMMRNMFQQMMGFDPMLGIPGMGPMPGLPPGMTSEGGKLRKSLLSDGDEAGHLISCIAFDSRAGSITFAMTEKDFAKFASFDVSIIRTDEWFRLPWSEHKLSDCERI